MPAFVGPMEVERIQDGGIKVGDTFKLSPKSSLKAASGAGSNNSGDIHRYYNEKNISNEYNPNVFDQNQFFNL
ncbi:spore germination protein [Bacillus carboniphilus]|uniref:Spore germination protein n=1 Tax=Bacillus carboniphilus TaxID=86663 RepID=A0ABY9JS81_9BACI|nr:spore germination protein [Bacillus carboniphilus]WLR41265.1 spore germination protein [Bacillus carboniphilus]